MLLGVRPKRRLPETSRFFAQINTDLPDVRSIEGLFRQDYFQSLGGYNIEEIKPASSNSLDGLLLRNTKDGMFGGLM
jgi:hypothetical protein